MEYRSTGAPSSAIRQRQAAFVFGEVEQLAFCIERFGVMLIADTGDERDTTALLVGIKAIAAQIAYISAVGERVCQGTPWAKVDAAKWLLPPAFHTAAADAGEQQ